MAGAAPRRPRTRPRRTLAWLALAAALSTGLWLAGERLLAPPTHPRYAEMLAAARSMQAAAQVLWPEKEARGLLPPPEADPNRTGMIGPEFTGITTSLGDPASKRSTTNPDLAAALVRLLSGLDLERGTSVVVVVSGSLVGGNIAAIAAVEALGLRPVVIASLTASMWGATDPEFNWLEIAGLLRGRGVLRSDTTAAVLGGNGAVGGGVDPADLDALRASAARAGVPIVETRPVAAVIDGLLAHVEAATGGQRPGAVINVGGALIGLGSCRESYEFQPGLTLHPVACTSGTPGIAMRLSAEGVPVLHVLNIRRLSLDLGLPFDPVPLPTPGNNPAVYGSDRP